MACESHSISMGKRIFQNQSGGQGPRQSDGISESLPRKAPAGITSEGGISGPTAEAGLGRRTEDTSAVKGCSPHGTDYMGEEETAMHPGYLATLRTGPRGRRREMVQKKSVLESLLELNEGFHQWETGPFHPLRPTGQQADGKSTETEKKKNPV